MTAPAVAQPTTGLAISEVSRLLGVPMPTLRSWELRYGVPAALHVSGRHRRYQPADLHELRLMRDQIARGLLASDAATVVRGLLGQVGPGPAFIEAFLTAAAESDPPAMRAVLQAARQELGLGGCVDEVLMPAMQQVGLWWQTGRCDVEQEHLATEVARSWLHGLAQESRTAATDPVLLACGPTDLHTVGLEALGVLLLAGGRACRLLGPRTSTLAVKTACQVNGAGAVVLVAHLSSGRQRAVQTLRTVRELDIPVFYAGNAFASARSRRSVPGEYLGTNLQDACAMINRSAPGRSIG